MSEVNLNAPLNKLKEEIDALEVKIVGCNDEMNSLKPFVKEFHHNKDKRKEFIKQKREKLNALNILVSYYKEATGEEPALGPLFAQESISTQIS